MKKAIKIAGKILLGFLLAIIVFVATMFLITKGDYSVPKTVEDDKTIPHIQINNVVFHAETFGNDTSEREIILT